MTDESLAAEVMPHYGAARCMTVVIGLFVLLALGGCTENRPTKTADSSPIPPDPKARLEIPVKPNAKPAPAVEMPAAGVDTSPPKTPQPQQVFRPDDHRPAHDPTRLAAAGIRIFESRRLKLYTDIDPDIARTLPDLIDQLYPAWEEYLGPLPPDRSGSDFQMSGYLMKDMALFREFGLVPEELYIDHGRHLRNEFWLRDQAYEYYRRHLLIHEATHCFMTFMPDVQAPVWYQEGMAEYFATHRLDDKRRSTFRVMPTSRAAFMGFDRITTVRDEVAFQKFKSMADIFDFRPVDFVTVPHYAWSWALCIFLDQSPRYHERFQQLSRSTVGGQLPRKFAELFERDKRDLATEWTLFCANLQYGYDAPRAAIDFHSGTKLLHEQCRQVKADAGWQSSGVRLDQDRTYKITASGQFQLGDKPKPWVSEPQGISFRYFDGRPIGTLLGCLRSEEGTAGGSDEPMLQVFPIGREAEFKAPLSGTLYLRLNDAWNSLHDNQGHADVTIRAVN